MDAIYSAGQAVLAELAPGILKKAMDQQANAALKLIQSNTENIINLNQLDYMGNHVDIKV